MGHLTQYSQNRANIAGSIAACYMREEALGFCTEYMTPYKAGTKHVWEKDEELFVSGEVLTGKGTPVILSAEEAIEIHDFVLQSVNFLDPWRR